MTSALRQEGGVGLRLLLVWLEGGGGGGGGAEVVSVPPAFSAALGREYGTEEGTSPAISEIAAPVPGWGSCSPSCGVYSVRRVSD